MTTRLNYRIGDKVSIQHAKYPGVWIVTSTSGPKNAVVTPEGGGRGMRVPYDLLIAPVDGATVTAVPTLVFYDLGEFVRIPSGKFAGLYVVTADRGGDKVNVALAGGDGGRYVRAMRTSLIKVDAQEVLK